MFEGSNTLVLNVATMKQALQYWFDNAVYLEGAAPTVEDVRSRTEGSCQLFDIKLGASEGE